MSSGKSIMRRDVVRIAGAAVLAPMSVLLQGMPPLFLTPWMMRIDFAAVPWIVCWVVFGWKAALLCLAVSAPLVGIVGPFAGGWVGAVMKSVSSVWMFAIPAFFSSWTKGVRGLIQRRRVLAASGLSALAFRAVVTVFFNLYFSLPVFFGWNYETIIQIFSDPHALSFVSTNLGVVGLSAFIAEIAFWNTVQGGVDLLAGFSIGGIVLRRFLLANRETKA